MFSEADWASIEWFFLFISPTKRASAIAGDSINDLKWSQVDGVGVKVRIGRMVVENVDQSTYSALKVAFYDISFTSRNFTGKMRNPTTNLRR